MGNTFNKTVCQCGNEKPPEVEVCVNCMCVKDDCTNPKFPGTNKCKFHGRMCRDCENYTGCEQYCKEHRCVYTGCSGKRMLRRPDMYKYCTYHKCPRHKCHKLRTNCKAHVCNKCYTKVKGVGSKYCTDCMLAIKRDCLPQSRTKLDNAPPEYDDVANPKITVIVL